MADVARKTRISARFLESLEEEKFEALPGIVFARSFIRQYSNLLNLDTEDLLSKVPKVDTATIPMPNVEQRERYYAPEPGSGMQWDPRWNSIIASVMWIGLGVGAAVGAYLYFNRQVPGTVASTRSQEPAKAADAPKPEPVKADVAKPEESKASEPSSSATSTVAATPVGSAVVPPKPTSGKPVQVTVTATEPSWINVFADGKSSFTGILVANDTKTIDAMSNVRLTAGNAGGVKVSLNGKELDPLGPHGQVRTVRITAEGLQLAPKSAAAPPLDPL